MANSIPRRGERTGPWLRVAGAGATQVRVVHAIMLREIKTRFGRQRMGYLWAVLEPTAFVAIFALMFAYGNQTAPSGMPVVPFLITGFAPFLLFRSTMTQTMGAIETNRILLTFPQITPTDLVLARALLEMATLTAVFFLLLPWPTCWASASGSRTRSKRFSPWGAWR